MKYNPETTLEDALKLFPACKSISDLARKMGIRRKTLENILDKQVERVEGETLFEALSAHAEASGGTELLGIVEQLRFWKTKSAALEKRVGKQDWFIDTLKEVVSVLKLEKVEFPKPYPVPKDKSEHAVMLVLSDLHYGLKADNLGVFPIFNSEIARKAIEEVFLRALSIIEKKSSYMDVQNVIINFAGDLVEHNFLRRGHRGQVDRHVTQQVVEVSRILAEGIRIFAGRFPKVYISGVPGNHGRADPVPGAGDPTESFDWLTFQFIQEILSGQPNIEFWFPECWYSLIRVFDFLTFTMHGEDIQSWAGIPWYGLSRAIKDILMMLTHVSKNELALLDRTSTLTLEEFQEILKIPDGVIIGHFHTDIDWDEIGVDALCNGSLVGATRHSLKRRRRLSRPCQKLLFFHPEWGMVGDDKVFIQDIAYGAEPRETMKVLQVG